MNNANNANNAKMNELLLKIGTKTNFNKLKNKVKGTNRESTEFLNILQTKINKIKDDVKLSNIEKKTDELKKIFIKFKNFSDKIKNKNKKDYYRYHEIYSNTLYYICPYLSGIILNILASSNQSIGELLKLGRTHNELLNLFIWYYDQNNIEYKNMKDVQDEIYLRIEIHPLNPNSSSRASVITHHSSTTANANISNNQKFTHHSSATANANISHNQKIQRLQQMLSQLQIKTSQRYNTKKNSK